MSKMRSLDAVAHPRKFVGPARGNRLRCGWAFALCLVVGSAIAEDGHTPEFSYGDAELEQQAVDEWEGDLYT